MDRPARQQWRGNNGVAALYGRGVRTRAGMGQEWRGSKKLFRDLRRTGVRNLIRAGVSAVMAMKISGHKTGSVFDCYTIIDDRDILAAPEMLDAANDSRNKYKRLIGSKKSRLNCHV